MKIEYNEKLLENINEEFRETGEILLFLIYRKIDPIEFFSKFQGGLEEVNHCITTLTRYGIIEFNDTEDNIEGSFKLKRPLFINDIHKQNYNVNDIRKYFTKTFTGQIHRNCTKEHTEYLIAKFLEKHPYKWEDVVSVTKEFMIRVVSENAKYAPSLPSFIEKYLLIGLEELELGKELTVPKKPGLNDFDEFML